LHKDYDVIGIDEAQFFEDVMLLDDLKHSFLDCCWMWNTCKGEQDCSGSWLGWDILKSSLYC